MQGKQHSSSGSLVTFIAMPAHGDQSFWPIPNCEPRQSVDVYLEGFSSAIDVGESSGRSGNSIHPSQSHLGIFG